MEQLEKDYLLKWKEDLEKENKKIIKEIAEVENQMFELRTKKYLLSDIIRSSFEDPSLDEFKLSSGYDEICNQLSLLEERDTSLEEKNKSQLHYNKVIINAINQQLATLLNN